MEEQTKQCKDCKQQRPITDFHKHSSFTSGRENKCKHCKDYYVRNKTKMREKQKVYDQTHNRYEYRKEYRIKNKEKNSARNVKRYATDPIFRIKAVIFGRIHNAFRCNRHHKNNKTQILIGCTFPELKQHLESQFKPEMNWDNHGSIWEIDHIIACAKFDLSNPEEQKKCFHYTNLQPLFKTTAIAESFGYTNEIGNRNKHKN